MSKEIIVSHIVISNPLYYDEIFVLMCYMHPNSLRKLFWWGTV